MSFKKLEPPTPASLRHPVSATVTVRQDGLARLNIIFLQALLDAYGKPSRADVSVGEGDDAGSLLLEFGAKGAYALQSLGRGGARLMLVHLPGYRSAAAKRICELGDRTASSLVVKLPAEPLGKAAQPAAPPAAKPPADAGEDGKLDLVRYLRVKGETVARIGEGRFELNGKVVDLAAALAATNVHRKKASLEPLSIDKVF